MIDLVTGIITVDDGASIGPLVTRAAFLASPLAVGAKRGVSPVAPWAGFTTLRASDGLLFLVTPIFRDDALQSVSFTQVDTGYDPETEKSWDDWSAEKENAHQASNEAWVARSLGPPHESFPWGTYPDRKRWEFSWGVVESSQGPQDGGTSVLVSYGK